MRHAWVGLLFGALFGFVLAWADLTNPAVIHDMLRLREAHVFLIMGTAIVVAAAGSLGLRALGTRSWLTREPIGWSTARPERRHVIGSVMFGIGWSIAGTCPAPVAAMLGRGQVGALLVVGGLVAGITAQGALARRRQGTVPRIDTVCAGL